MRVNKIALSFYEESSPAFYETPNERTHPFDVRDRFGESATMYYKFMERNWKILQAELSQPILNLIYFLLKFVKTD